jgi:hypothetical protein
VEAALAEPKCLPLKKTHTTASPHPKTALEAGAALQRHGPDQRCMSHVLASSSVGLLLARSVRRRGQHKKQAHKNEQVLWAGCT